MTTPLIILSAVAAWWLLLTLFVIWSYIQQVREAKAARLTPEQLEEARRLDERMPRVQMRRRDYFIVGPLIIAFVLFLLPLVLYCLFIEWRDPYDRQHKT